MKRTGTIITLLIIATAFIVGIWYIYTKDKQKIRAQHQSETRGWVIEARPCCSAWRTSRRPRT